MRRNPDTSLMKRDWKAGKGTDTWKMTMNQQGWKQNNDAENNDFCGLRDPKAPKIYLQSISNQNLIVLS